MSVHYIYYKDGAKRMRPILTREEYLSLRNGGEQRRLVERIRAGEEGLKSKLVQMNYSCLPNEDGSLKGSKTMSTTVGMDIDHLSKEEMPTVRERILQKKEELGLLMLEESARGGGYHLVFRRRPELSQEENLKWASELLEVQYDDGAKDITRVFFTTTGSAEDLLFLDDKIFEVVTALQCDSSNQANTDTTDGTDNPSNPINPCSVAYDKDASYNGILFTEIIAKYWELFNGGKEPVEGDRNALTFELAVTLRSICGYSLEKMMQVVPNYWAKKCTEGSVPLCT